jgi:hypothetical protein
MTGLRDLLLHTPWYIALLIILAGGGLSRWGNRRQDKALLRVGLTILVVGFVLGAVGLLFPSDREKMEKRTGQIVAAVDKSDWTSLASLVDDRTAVGTIARQVAAGRNELVEQVKKAREKWSVQSVTSSGIQSVQNDSLITVTLSVYAQTADSGPSLSSWQFDYQESGNDWMLEKITLIRVGGVSPDDVFDVMH